MSGPLRRILLTTSSLVPSVNSGVGALKNIDKPKVDLRVRQVIGDSLDLDAAARQACPEENRWDYLLGVKEPQCVIGIEPHSANQGEISVVVAKKKWAVDFVRGHLKPGRLVAAWYWVSSGPVGFQDTGRERRRLDQSGITFVGRLLRPTDL